MITEQHLKFIEERNIVILKRHSGYFVYKKNFVKLGRFFSSYTDNLKIQNIHDTAEGKPCALKDVNPVCLPYILSYISDYNTSLFYYKKGDELKFCAKEEDYSGAILIRNHDNIFKYAFVNPIRFINNAPLTIDITNAKIVRNPRNENFVVLDNTKQILYVSNKDILEILARESCVEALDIAYGLLRKLKSASLERIEIPVDILERLKNERPNYYEEIKLRNKN